MKPLHLSIPGLIAFLSLSPTTLALPARASSPKVSMMTHWFTPTKTIIETKWVPTATIASKGTHAISRAESVRVSEKRSPLSISKPINRNSPSIPENYPTFRLHGTETQWYYPWPEAMITATPEGESGSLRSVETESPILQLAKRSPSLNADPEFSRLSDHVKREAPSTPVVNIYVQTPASQKSDAMAEEYANTMARIKAEAQMAVPVNLEKVSGPIDLLIPTENHQLVPVTIIEEVPINLELTEKLPVSEIVTQEVTMAPVLIPLAPEAVLKPEAAPIEMTLLKPGDAIVVDGNKVMTAGSAEKTVGAASGYFEELPPAPTFSRAPVWSKGVFQKAGVMIPLILALTLGLVAAIFGCLKYCTNHEYYDDRDALPVSRTGLPPSYRPAHGRTDTDASRGEHEHRHPHGIFGRALHPFHHQETAQDSDSDRDQPTTAGAVNEEKQQPIKNHQAYPRPGQFKSPEDGTRIMNFGSIVGRLWNPMEPKPEDLIDEEKAPCPGFQTAEDPIEVARLDRLKGSQHLPTTFVLRMAADRLSKLSDSDRIPKVARGSSPDKKANAAATGSERHPDATARRRKGLRDVWLDDIVSKKAPGTEHIMKGRKPEVSPSVSKKFEDQKRAPAPLHHGPSKLGPTKDMCASAVSVIDSDDSGSDESDPRPISTSKPVRTSASRSNKIKPTPEVKKPKEIRIGETSRASPTYHTAPIPKAESAKISDESVHGEPPRAGTTRRVRIQSPVPQESSVGGGWGSTSEDSSEGSSDASLEPESRSNAQTAGPTYTGPVLRGDSYDSECSSSSAESSEVSPTSEGRPSSKAPVPQNSGSQSNTSPRYRMTDAPSPIREGKKPAFLTTSRIQSSSAVPGRDANIPGAFPRQNPRSKPSFDSSLTHKATNNHPPSSSEGSSSAGSSRSSSPIPQHPSQRLQKGPRNTNSQRRESSDLSDTIKHHARRNVRRAPTDGACDTDSSDDDEYPSVFDKIFIGEPRRMPISADLFCTSPFQGSAMSTESVMNPLPDAYNNDSGEGIKHGESIACNGMIMAH